MSTVSSSSKYSRKNSPLKEKNKSTPRKLGRTPLKDVLSSPRPPLTPVRNDVSKQTNNNVKRSLDEEIGMISDEDEPHPLKASKRTVEDLPKKGSRKDKVSKTKRKADKEKQYNSDDNDDVSQPTPASVVSVQSSDDETPVDRGERRRGKKKKKMTGKGSSKSTNHHAVLTELEISKKAAETRVVVPTLSNMEEMSKILEDEGLESDLKMPPNWLRTDKKTDENAPAGEWEVQEILDSGIQDDGTVVYKVHWKGWDDEKDHTWEPVKNLTNSKHLLKQYHEKLCKMDEKEAIKNLIRLILVLMKVTDHDRDIDTGLLLKLCRKDLSFVEKKGWVKELQNWLKQKCTMALDYLVRGPGELQTPGALLDMTVKELRIEDTFSSLEGMFDWIDKRESQEIGNQKRLKEINKSIAKFKDGPLITIENFVDDAVVPEFEYTSDYKPINIKYDNTPVIKCTCTNCFETKKVKKSVGEVCCWHECPKKPYGKTGVLLLDEREPIYECNSSCACGDSCPFKVVSKGRMYQVGVFRTPNDRGWGLKALERIPKGKFVITYTGDLVEADERDRRAIEQNRLEETYLMDLDYNPDQAEALFAIDARDVANCSRFINHSCEPNLGIHPVWVHNMDLNLPTIAFFSKDVIEKGAELTFDYNVRKTEENEARKQKDTDVGSGDEDDEPEPPPVFPCRCGAEKCKGFYF